MVYPTCYGRVTGTFFHVTGVTGLVALPTRHLRSTIPQFPPRVRFTIPPAIPVVFAPFTVCLISVDVDVIYVPVVIYRLIPVDVGRCICCYLPFTL